jgi:predicted esterase
MVKILCLHGYGQNLNKINQKLSGFKKLFKTSLEFVFLQAPFELPKRNSEDKEEEDAFAWWTYKDVDNIDWEKILADKLEITFSSHSTSTSSSSSVKDEKYINDTEIIGINQSIRYVKNYLDQNKDIVGVFGFSQGSAMLSVMTVLNFLPSNIKFLIFACGFLPIQYECKFDIPSMHIIGNLDTVILPKFSKELASIFKDPLIVESEYKHDINCNSASKKQYKTFIENVLKL